MPGLHARRYEQLPAHLATREREHEPCGQGSDCRDVTAAVAAVEVAVPE